MKTSRWSDVEELVDLLPYGLLVVNGAGEIVRLNAQLQAMFGFTEEQLLGQPVETLIPADQRVEHVAYRDAFGRAPAARRMGDAPAVTGRAADGTEFPIHVALRPLDGGATLAIVEDLRDTAPVALGRMASSTRQALGVTFGAIAHELNNPLACMLPSLEMASDLVRARDPDEPSNAELIEALRDCDEAAQRMRAIVVDMTTLGGLRDADQGAPLVEVAEATARLVAAKAPQGISVQVQADSDPRVACSSTQVGQILLNLCLNALHAMVEAGHRGKIVLDVGVAADDGVVDVRDEGPGVPVELRERIFAPYFTTRATGSGVGLALCRQKARRLAGDLVLARSDAGGSVFRVTLPLADT